MNKKSNKDEAMRQNMGQKLVPLAAGTLLGFWTQTCDQKKGFQSMCPIPIDPSAAALTSNPSINTLNVLSTTQCSTIATTNSRHFCLTPAGSVIAFGNMGSRFFVSYVAVRRPHSNHRFLPLHPLPIPDSKSLNMGVFRPSLVAFYMAKTIGIAETVIRTISRS